MSWEPGDPIYEQDPYSCGSYLYNFRDTPRELDENCFCGDAASWPTPFEHHNLDVLDAEIVTLRDAVAA